jgi:hypothetical protein
MRVSYTLFVVASLLASSALFAALPVPEFSGLKFTKRTFHGAACDYSLYVAKAGYWEGAFGVPTDIYLKMVKEGRGDARTIKNGHFAGQLDLGFPFVKTGTHRGSCEDAMAPELGQNGFPKQVYPAQLANVEFQLQKVSGVALATPLTFTLTGKRTDLLAYRGFKLELDQILPKAEVARIQAGRRADGETVLTARLLMKSVSQADISWSLTQLPSLVTANLRATASRNGRVTPSDVQSAVRSELKHLVSLTNAQVKGEVDGDFAEAVNRDLPDFVDGISRSIALSVLATEVDGSGAEISLNLDVLEKNLKMRIAGQASISLPGVQSVFPGRDLPALTVKVE